jgi:ribonuclease VapC
MIFVDASALVAVICGEDGSADIATCLETMETFITSPVAIYEATIAVARSTKVTLTEARKDVDELLTRIDIQSLPVAPEDSEAALLAFERYGKGRHKARLNMGDCFAYAMARSRNAAILFTGDDFIHTDLPNALAAG